MAAYILKSSDILNLNLLHNRHVKSKEENKNEVSDNVVLVLQTNLILSF